jgi:hypothetical protein
MNFWILYGRKFIIFSKEMQIYLQDESMAGMRSEPDPKDKTSNERSLYSLMALKGLIESERALLCSLSSINCL